MLYTLTRGRLNPVRSMRGLAATEGSAVPATGDIVGPGGIQPGAMLNDAISGAKAWLNPSAAITDFKNLFSATAQPRSAGYLAGLVAVPLAAVIILPSLLRTRRRR